LKTRRSKSETNTNVAAILERSPEAASAALVNGDLSSSLADENSLTLGLLPTGARLVLRCRKDWRDAVVSLVEPERVVLSVASPSGHTYRVRRPADSPLTLEGSIPILGEGSWRAARARYDARW
jgi:hypothetical protein